VNSDNLKGVLQQFVSRPLPSARHGSWCASWDPARWSASPGCRRSGKTSSSLHTMAAVAGARNRTFPVNSLELWIRSAVGRHRPSSLRCGGRCDGQKVTICRGRQGVCDMSQTRPRWRKPSPRTLGFAARSSVLRRWSRRLEARLNQDSQNSSKPPSTDPRGEAAAERRRAAGSRRSARTHG